VTETVVLIDQTNTIDPHELADTAQALSDAMQNEFADEYHVDVLVRIGTEAKTPSEYPLYLVNAAQLPTFPSGALGFHDDTEDLYVALDYCQRGGVSWSPCADHEIKEWAFDRSAILMAQRPYDGVIVALEVSDPVEQDTYFKEVNGRRVELSNWVTEGWFSGRGTRFDYLGKCSAAGLLTPGGYVSVFDPQVGWKQQQSEKGMSVYRKLMADHSRHAKRVARHDAYLRTRGSPG